MPECTCTVLPQGEVWLIRKCNLCRAATVLLEALEQAITILKEEFEFNSFLDEVLPPLAAAIDAAKGDR